VRIGEVNKDNYSFYLNLLGVKNTQSLDKLYGKSESDSSAVQNKDYSFEARAKRMVEIGYVEEGMMHEEGDVSWKKIVDVPDSIKQAVINKRRESILENANFTLSAKAGDEEAALAWSYVKTLPPSERASASWTLQKIAQAEGGRIGDYLKSKIPGLRPGLAFDRRILTDTNYGLDDKRLDILV
jgi:hypothetical protein